MKQHFDLKHCIRTNKYLLVGTYLSVWMTEHTNKISRCLAVACFNRGVWLWHSALREIYRCIDIQHNLSIFSIKYQCRENMRLNQQPPQLQLPNMQNTFYLSCQILSNFLKTASASCQTSRNEQVRHVQLVTLTDIILLSVARKLINFQILLKHNCSRSDTDEIVKAGPHCTTKHPPPYQTKYTNIIYRWL